MFACVYGCSGAFFYPLDSIHFPNILNFLRNNAFASSTHNHRLNAAQGWLELGDYLAANDELEKIDAGLRAHPQVLAIRYKIYAQARKWEDCVDIAKALTKLEPDNAWDWIHLAKAPYPSNFPQWTANVQGSLSNWRHENCKISRNVAGSR
jgi:hypothetical protein